MIRRLGAAVTAVFVAVNIGHAVDAAVPDLDELGTIAAYLEANDVEGLREYLLVRPELLEGDSDLVVLLREFMEQSRSLAGFLGAMPNQSQPGDRDSDESWAQDLLRRVLVEVDASDPGAEEPLSAPPGPDEEPDPDDDIY